MNANNNLDSINMDDIESRLIILKRRAAEADFLREERDMLLNRLKLYTNDYIWPEPEHTTIQNSEIFQKLKEENESLIKENDFLMEAVSSLEQEISSLDQIKIEFQLINEENALIKNELMKITSMEEELQNLIKEKGELSETLESVLQVLNSDDPNTECKHHIKRLLNRANYLKKEKEELRDMVHEKSLKIDVLLSKISHLEARLNEKTISTKLKIQLGEKLNSEEELIWTVEKLESANKMMAKDIAELTEKFNTINKTYGHLLKETKKEASETHRPMRVTHEPHELPLETKEELYEKRVLVGSDSHNLESLFKAMTMSHTGSSGPPSRADSLLSLEMRTAHGVPEVHLSTVHNNNQSILKYHHLLRDIKHKVQTEENLLNQQHNLFYADVLAKDSPGSFRMFGSVMYTRDDN